MGTLTFTPNHLPTPLLTHLQAIFPCNSQKSVHATHPSLVPSGPHGGLPQPPSATPPTRHLSRHAPLQPQWLLLMPRSATEPCTCHSPGLRPIPAATTFHPLSSFVHRLRSAQVSPPQRGPGQPPRPGGPPPRPSQGTAQQPGQCVCSSLPTWLGSLWSSLLRSTVSSMQRP